VTEENEMLDPEELAALGSTPFRTEVETRVTTDVDGFELNIWTETKTSMTPTGEIVVLKKEVCSRFVSCGHQLTHPTQASRCKYEGHVVCRNCITTCQGCRELVCLQHSDEWEYEGEILRLCLDCGEEFEYEMRKENSLTKRILRLIRNKLTKEE
jgi:hypothetical protein